MCKFYLSLSILQQECFFVFIFLSVRLSVSHVQIFRKYMLVTKWRHHVADLVVLSSVFPYRMFYVCSLKECTQTMNIYLIFLMLWWPQSSIIYDNVCSLWVTRLHFLCFQTGESDEREQSKLEVKVWDPNSPLTDRQIDQFLVVARWVWCCWVSRCLCVL